MRGDVGKVGETGAMRGMGGCAMARRVVWVALLSSLSLSLANLVGCSTPTMRQGNSAEWDKIGFDLSLLDADGLMGGSSEKRALHYELCIPAKAKYVREIGDIDSTLVVSPASGRIGCSPDQYLCIGSTHQKNFRDVLLRLARLDFVEQIVESTFE